ncbi:MAG: DUF4321 domain-containing protein [Gemmatimonadaceae bacterium]|jgi:hypothetical protein|nr:DUF4321 domain-containing protein [Gemmatimonadaceae bacterium]
MPPQGSAKHRPGYHAIVLATGFVLGGFMHQFARMALPAGAVKEFLNLGFVTPSIGPLPIDLIVIKFALGPIALDVSLLSLVGVLAAYLIARSLF